MSETIHDVGNETSHLVPDGLVRSLAQYIGYGNVEDIYPFDEHAEEAWQKAVEEADTFTREVGRRMSPAENIELFVRASQEAYAVHQQYRSPNSRQVLSIPDKFKDRRIVSDAGWGYISQYFEPRPTIV